MLKEKKKKKQQTKQLHLGLSELGLGNRISKLHLGHSFLACGTIGSTLAPHSFVSTVDCHPSASALVGHHPNFASGFRTSLYDSALHTFYSTLLLLPCDFTFVKIHFIALEMRFVIDFMMLQRPKKITKTSNITTYLQCQHTIKLNCH